MTIWEAFALQPFRHRADDPCTTTEHSMTTRKSNCPTPAQADAARRMGLILSFHAPEVLGSSEGLLLPPTVARIVAAHFKTWRHAAETECFALIGPYYRPEEVSFALIPHEFYEQNGSVPVADPEHSAVSRFKRLLEALRSTADTLRTDATTPDSQREDPAKHENNSGVPPVMPQPDNPAGPAMRGPRAREVQSPDAKAQVFVDVVDTLNKGRMAIQFVPPPQCGTVELPPPGTVIKKPKEKVHPVFGLTGTVHGLLRNGNLVAVEKWLLRRPGGNGVSLIGTQFSAKVRATGDTYSFPVYEIVEEEDGADNPLKDPDPS